VTYFVAVAFGANLFNTTFNSFWFWNCYGNQLYVYPVCDLETSGLY